MTLMLPCTCHHDFVVPVIVNIDHWCCALIILTYMLPQPLYKTASKLPVINSGAIWLVQINHEFHAGETRMEPIARPFKHHILYNILPISVTFIMRLLQMYLYEEMSISSLSRHELWTRSPLCRNHDTSSRRQHRTVKIKHKICRCFALTRCATIQF